MKQAISGVAPSEMDEVTAMVVWPTITSLKTPPLGRLGCTLGRLYGIQWDFGRILTIGNIIALLSIPLALVLFAQSLAPFFSRRYRLTNRRVIVERLVLRRGKGWLPIQAPWVEEVAVKLDNFDQIDVEVQKGQEWYPAGDLIFRKGDVETLRLLGVSRPETFRHTCLKGHASFVGVREAIGA